MRSLTVRLPESLVSEIEAESRGRKVSKSDIVRERLELGPGRAKTPPASFKAIADIVGSVSGLPVDLSYRKKAYLRGTGYGKKRTR
jgi:Arc/MetJ-type ribon-helix-helix transcriptional regulator